MEKKKEKVIPFSFYGPTCDSSDFLKGPFFLPKSIKNDDYIEGSAKGVGGVNTNGWCWNGGDSDGNIFKGRAGWNHSSYSGCFEPGHWGYIGVFSTNSTQYENADITVTNWFAGTDTSLTAVSFFAREIVEEPTDEGETSESE